MARCLVLDLDGTITDSLPDIAGALNRSLASHGQPPLPLEQVRPMVGDGVAQLFQRGYAARGLTPSPEDMAAGLADYTANSTAGTVLYPGAMEALRALAADGWRLAVCTNKPAAPARVLLEHVGLREEQRRLEAAVAAVLNEDGVRTGDLGGRATTVAFTEAVIARLR